VIRKPTAHSKDIMPSEIGTETNEDHSDEPYELSVIMPCLNERETLVDGPGHFVTRVCMRRLASV
jgi:hypothetical protein